MPILGENESVEKTIVREGHSKMKKIVLALTCGSILYVAFKETPLP